MNSEVLPTQPHVGTSRRWRTMFWLSAILTLGLVASLVPHFENSAELVRMRNALLYQSEAATYDWSPDNVPAGFLVESNPPIPLYARIVRDNALQMEGDDWATALKIGRHLLSPRLARGKAIQSDLTDTYQRIMRTGEGYCGDYADTFTGLASAAGVFSRPWAFSFDGFGGHGHIFNEIWDRRAQRWIMIDVFNNFYFADAAGQPLSAMAVRNALLTPGAMRPRIVAIDPEAQPGYKYEDKAYEFYVRGIPEWYMWWGNNVFGYDQTPLVSMLGNIDRAVEQLGGIAAGVQPAIRVIETVQNQSQREAILWLRVRLIAIVVFGALSVALLIGWLLSRGFARREMQ